MVHGLASFEEVPPALEEMRRRYDDVAGRGLPWLVAEIGGAVAGYGYCAPYRSRSAYRYALEDSVYVRQDAQGKGVGSGLLRELIARCEALGYRQMIAVIGDSANAGSIGVHTKTGFQMIGTHPSVGLKFGRWLDTVMMQRALGEGAATVPADSKG